MHTTDKIVQRSGACFREGNERHGERTLGRFLDRRVRKVVSVNPRGPQQPLRGESHNENTSDEKLETSHEGIPSTTPAKGCFGDAVYTAFLRAINEIHHR